METWPSSTIASAMGIRSELPYFEILNAEEREPIAAKEFFEK